MLTNKAFPNYIKIGSTMKDPRIRAHELTGTGVPFPYEVKFKIMTKNCEILEKKVHTILEKKRVDLEREFFECPVEEAKKIIDHAGATKPLPLVVRASTDTLPISWPKNRESVHTSDGKMNKVRVIIQDFLKENGYQVVWYNKDFEILIPAIKDK